jgi:hypothetical protein
LVAYSEPQPYAVTGVEDIKRKMPLFAEPPKQPRRKLSKAELRQQAAAAFLAWRAGQTSKNK